MAPDGQPPPHLGHQQLVPAVPLAGAQVHEEPGALPAPQDPHRLQLQHGLPQLLHLQRGGRLVLNVQNRHCIPPLNVEPYMAVFVP